MRWTTINILSPGEDDATEFLRLWVQTGMVTATIEIKTGSESETLNSPDDFVNVRQWAGIAFKLGV